VAGENTFAASSGLIFGQASEYRMGLNIRDLEISSPAFEPEGTIPDRHARQGGDVQPELRIQGIPAGTVELALICHDPNAPLPFGFTHWALYGVPPDIGVIPEKGADTLRAGQNGFGETGYGGPQPPAGHGLHHYYFWVYALDARVEGEPSRETFLARYADNILEQNRLVGTYQA
jgi:Raf kinase inhibitor-like YbhB/YbcL family protein